MASDNLFFRPRLTASARIECPPGKGEISTLADMPPDALTDDMDSDTQFQALPGFVGRVHRGFQRETEGQAGTVSQ